MYFCSYLIVVTLSVFSLVMVKIVVKNADSPLPISGSGDYFVYNNITEIEPNVKHHTYLTIALYRCTLAILQIFQKTPYSKRRILSASQS